MSEGFKISKDFEMEGEGATPYRVAVTVEYPCAKDVDSYDDPFHENIRVNIENMVLMRLLDEVSGEARKIIHGSPWMLRLSETCVSLST